MNAKNDNESHKKNTGSNKKLNKKIVPVTDVLEVKTKPHRGINDPDVLENMIRRKEETKAENKTATDSNQIYSNPSKEETNRNQTNRYTRNEPNRNARNEPNRYTKNEQNRNQTNLYTRNEPNRYQNEANRYSRNNNNNQFKNQYKNNYGAKRINIKSHEEYPTLN